MERGFLNLELDGGCTGMYLHKNLWSCTFHICMLYVPYCAYFILRFLKILGKKKG